MIDMEWIRKQPLPVAIHCPDIDNVMEVLDSAAPFLRDGRIKLEELRMRQAWGNYGDRTCIRVKFLDRNLVALGRNTKRFYEDLYTDYILVDINSVRLEGCVTIEDNFDESVVLSMLFGDGVSE